MNETAEAATGNVLLAIREVDRVEEEYRARDCERLELQTATGDLHAAKDRMFAADRSLPDEAQPS